MVSKVIQDIPASIMSLNSLQPKPTPTPAPLATSDIASEPTVPEVVPSQTEPTTIPAVTSSEVTQETTTSSQSTSDPGSSSLGDLLSGQNLQGAIDNIVEMGFPRDRVMRAMRASFNNADRAVEYLMAVSAFAIFSGCFNLIYYSRDSQHMPRLMFLRQLSALRFRPQLPMWHQPRISLKIYSRFILSFILPSFPSRSRYQSNS
jgi:UBA/TS-N domain